MNEIVKYLPRIGYIFSECGCVKTVVRHFITVLLPCLLIGSSFALGYEHSEHLYGGSMTGNGVSEDFINIGRAPFCLPVFLGEIDGGKGESKGGTQLPCGFIVLCDSNVLINSGYSQSVFYLSLKQVTKDSASGSCKNDLYNFCHDYPFLVVMTFCCGCLFILLLLSLFSPHNVEHVGRGIPRTDDAGVGQRYAPKPQEELEL